MVAINLPPPTRRVDPQHTTLPVGTSLVRLFRPGSHGATALSFRTHGPHKRFDHQRHERPTPTDDPDRGIYYAALTFQGCLVEVFGDNGTGIVEPRGWMVAAPCLQSDLQLLDLRGKGEANGAWLAGSVAALSANAGYIPSQAWSRHFYECSEEYGCIDGLLYENAHNGDDAIALYERAAASLACPPDRIIRLDDPHMRPGLITWAHRAGFVLAP